MSFLNKNTYLIFIIIGFIALYVIATDVLHILDAGLFPSISKILSVAYQSHNELLEGVISSSLLLIPSYFSALFLGIIVGLVVGWYAPLRKNLLPLFRGASSIPPTLLIPYSIALLPTFWLASSCIIFIGCFFPVCLGTIHGVVLIEERYLDNARTLNLKGFRLLRKIILPASLPAIFSGAGTALIFAFILLTISEMFGVKSGIGFFIQHYAEFFDYARVLAGLFVIASFIIVIMMIFDKIQNRMLYWTIKR